MLPRSWILGATACRGRACVSDDLVGEVGLRCWLCELIELFLRFGDRVVEAETLPCGKDDGGGGTGGTPCPMLSDVVLCDFSEALSGMTIVFGREVSDANVPVTARFMFCIELAARGFLNFGGPYHQP